jgi:hypothetical protein
MTINVYWTCIENEWLRAEQPEPVSNIFYKERKFDKLDPHVNMHHCPAFNQHLYNMFGLKSIYNYKFSINNGSVQTDLYDQDFFNRHVNIKSINKKLFSFQQSFIFFTDQDSLPTTLSLPPYFEDNNITRRCTVLPGEMDIGKWFRTTDLSFFLKDNFDEFFIEEGEIFSYIKFHTLEKINFCQFRFTPLLGTYLFDVLASKNNKKRFFNLDKFYSLLKTKSLILKEIRNNILEQ